MVYPVHSNLRVHDRVNSILAGMERIRLTSPLNYLTSVNLMRRVCLNPTDSGGMQEEAPTFRKPVLVLRRVTERPEAYVSGLSKVVGTNRQTILTEASLLLTDVAASKAMSDVQNPYGDGRAAKCIGEALSRWSHRQSPCSIRKPNSGPSV